MRRARFLAWLFVFWFWLSGVAAFATTYHVRPDGGDATQCDGLRDRPYAPDAEGHCAWNHPFWALDEQGRWKLKAGDTLLIHPGSYMMGYGAPNTKWCSQHWPWRCHLPPVPSGVKILGDCDDPPELWGTERASTILSLKGSQNVEVACLELTDHAACVEFHPATEVACKRDAYPFGPWAKAGLTASDSAHVTLRRLNVHGFANRGIIAYRIRDWKLVDVRIAGNGWAGWEGDAGPGQDSANSGTILFERVTVEWNGCVEDRQGQPTFCQSGYGDGLGTGATGGHWIFRDCVFRHNTSDGLDLLYLKVGEDTSVEIEGLRAYGNAGNQVKLRGHRLKIVNAIIRGDCDFFEGQPFNFRVTSCRAGGDALAVHVPEGGQGALVNSYVDGRGNVLILIASLGPNATFKIYNDVLVGRDNFFNHGLVGMVYRDRVDASARLVVSHVIAHHLKPNSLVPGEAVRTEDPKLGDDLIPQPGSPALDAGLPVGYDDLVPPVDIRGVRRPQGPGVDLGPFEVAASEGEEEGGGGQKEEKCRCDCTKAYQEGYDACRQTLLNFFDLLLKEGR